jgi:hypothetical protein
VSRVIFRSGFWPANTKAGAGANLEKEEEFGSRERQCVTREMRSRVVLRSREISGSTVDERMEGVSFGGRDCRVEIRESRDRMRRVSCTSVAD